MLSWSMPKSEICNRVPAFSWPIFSSLGPKNVKRKNEFTKFVVFEEGVWDISIRSDSFDVVQGILFSNEILIDQIVSFHDRHNRIFILRSLIVNIMFIKILNQKTQKSRMTPSHFFSFEPGLALLLIKSHLGSQKSPNNFRKLIMI